MPRERYTSYKARTTSTGGAGGLLWQNYIFAMAR